jgi:hypothetical protein
MSRHSSGMWGPYGGQSPISNTMLGAACHPLSSVVARAHKGGSVGLRCRFFLYSLFSLSFPKKTRLNFQKNNYVLWFVILSIFVLLLLITAYLAFDAF